MFVAAADAQTVEKDGLVKLTADKSILHVLHEGRSIKVQRVQNQEYDFEGYFSKTARKFPFCIQPVQVEPSVAAIGEIEVI